MSVDSAFRMVERLADRLNQNPQAVERGIHMAERIGSNLVIATPHFLAAAERLPHLSNAAHNALGNADRIGQISERSLPVIANEVLSPREITDRFVKHHRSEAEKAKQAAEKAAKDAERAAKAAEQAARQQRARDQAGENIDDLASAGLDLLQAIGWGAAGNEDQAAENAVEGGKKIWDVFTRSFWGPGND